MAMGGAGTGTAGTVKSIGYDFVGENTKQLGG